MTRVLDTPELSLSGSDTEGGVDWSKGHVDR